MVECIELFKNDRDSHCRPSVFGYYNMLRSKFCDVLNGIAVVEGTWRTITTRALHLTIAKCISALEAAEERRELE